MIKRRQFLINTGLALGAIAIAPSFAFESKKRNIGIQLYTLRESLPKNVKGVLEQIGKVGFNEVETYGYSPTKPQNVQGVIALADQMDENMGGFQCIPELYRNYDTWKLTQPEDRDRFKPNTTGLEDKFVKLRNELDILFQSSRSRRRV